MGQEKRGEGILRELLRFQYAPIALAKAIRHRWIFPVEKTDFALREWMRSLLDHRMAVTTRLPGRSGIVVEDVPHGADASEEFRLVGVVLEVFAEPHDEVVHGP